jgi:3-oxoadipate enol-lactonase
MAYQQINGANYYYEEHGSGEETIVFSHGFLWSGHMFEKQVETLKDRYRVITYDHRGQGLSEVTKDGYDVDTLTQDAVALIQSLNAVPCHFAGLSMGGFVALRLAIRHPELLKSLILMETSADPEPKANLLKYLALAVIARWLSPKLVSNRAMAVMFSRTFLNDPNRVDEREAWKRIIEANDRVGMYRALQGVIHRQGVYEQLGQIKLPTLIIVGEEDVATVPEKAERIHAAIEGSRLVTIPGAGHTSTVSQPERVTRAIENFLDDLQD